MIDLPYFDRLLEERRRGLPTGLLFKDFVHWGYWEDPRQAAGTEEDFIAAMGRLNQLLLDAAVLEDGQKVLDAGCGFGGTLASINASRKGMDLKGINIDARQLAEARKQVKAADGSSLEFVEGDACALPFEAASFDRVLAVECVFHFPSRERFLKEAARVLVPGGRLVLSDFVPLWGWHGGTAGGWLERRITRAYGHVGEPPDAPYAELARRAGLETLLDRDITRETLPTYSFLLDWLKTRAEPEARELMEGPTWWLAWLSRLGLLRYRLLAWRKPVGPE